MNERIHAHLCVLRVSLASVFLFVVRILRMLCETCVVQNVPIRKRVVGSTVHTSKHVCNEPFAAIGA